MIKRITSRENKIIKLTASLQKRNGRQKHGLFIAEGRRLTDEALRWGSRNISFLLISDSFAEKNPDYAAGFEMYQVSDSLFSHISGTETPQGVLAIMKISVSGESDILSDNLLILDGVSEPGNMGTILRTAEAMGFKDVFILKGSADIYSPKVVRSTMGSIFRLNFHFEDNAEFIKDLKQKGYKIISAALSDSVSVEKVPKFPKNAIVIGNEAAGISDEVLGVSDFIAKIDMVGDTESLNASVAAGIMMYKFSQKEV